MLAHKMMLKSLGRGHSVGKGWALSNNCGVQMWCEPLLLPLDLILLVGLWKGLGSLYAFFVFIIKVALSKIILVTGFWDGMGAVCFPSSDKGKEGKDPRPRVPRG